MIKQALINIEYPLRQSDTSKNVCASTWQVNVIAGQLDGWRDVADSDAGLAWDDATYAVRSIVANVAEENEMVYAFGCGMADKLANLICEWPAERCWVSPPRPGIPKDTPEHDVIALKSSLQPLPEFLPGNVFKQVEAVSFSAEKWWPGSTALLLPAFSAGYRERLENALRAGDYSLAQRLVFVSPGVSKASPGIFINDFGSNPELLNSVTLYVMAGAHAKCVVSANYYSKQIGIKKFLDCALNVFISNGYDCYRSNGIETFREWTTSGVLPKGLKVMD